MIHLVQCLCPNRHAIMAALYDPADVETGGPNELRATVEALITAHAIDPWCGICKAKSEQWHYEDAPTLWRTMAEALPAAKAVEAANRATREFLKAGRN